MNILEAVSDLCFSGELNGVPLPDDGTRSSLEDKPIDLLEEFSPLEMSELRFPDTLDGKESSGVDDLDGMGMHFTGVD